MTSLIWVALGSSVLSLVIEQTELISTRESGNIEAHCPSKCQGGFPHFVGSEIRAHARGAFLVLKDEARLTAGDMPDRLDYPDGMYAKASRPSRFRDALGQRAGAHISRTKGQAEAKARIAEAT